MVEPPAEILLVEDNPVDIMLIKESLKAIKIPHNLVLTSDENTALQILRKESPYDKAKTPDLIMLNIKLPGMDVHDLLKKIKNENELKIIPIVVLTTSITIEELSTYKNHANAFITKPINLDELIGVIRSTQIFWINRLLPDSLNNKL